MIPDEIVITKLSELDELSCLTPKQVGMILGKTEKQLEETRKAGTGPKFDTNGGRVRYFVGHVRDYQRNRMNNHTYLTTLEAKLADENRVAGFDVQKARRKSTLGFNSLDEFLIYSDGDDLWPFAIVAGQPIDFFKSLRMELLEEDECCWLNMEEYMRLIAASDISTAKSDVLNDRNTP